MTGYAIASAAHGGLTLTVTIRSVNHRHLDLRIHMPDTLLPLEGKLRSLLQTCSPRGHVDVRVAFETPGAGELTLDEQALRRYVETLRQVGTQVGLPGPTDLAALSQLPGVIARKESVAGIQSTPELEAVFLEIVSTAIERWDAMRAEEAALLASDMRTRMAAIGESVAELEHLQAGTLQRAKQLLAERLQSLVEAVAPLEPARLAQEALILAERSDASEELLRLRAHLSQFLKLLDGEADAGRKLDFLLQEMQREANTLLSKVAALGEASLPLTRGALDVKAEIEKLREQVQNLQ
jgi:uncharacterized protein (TIGR00255 family)